VLIESLVLFFLSHNHGALHSREFRYHYLNMSINSTQNSFLFCMPNFYIQNLRQATQNHTAQPDCTPLNVCTFLV
jgi:hypothetical protein